jgi:hypothetical protein
MQGVDRLPVTANQQALVVVPRNHGNDLLFTFVDFHLALQLELVEHPFEHDADPLRGLFGHRLRRVRRHTGAVY